jgi:hypothetical protein
MLFSSDTTIVPLQVKVLLAGIPLTPVPRIAGAIFHAATNPDPETNGCAWVLPDDGPVFRVKPEEFKQGVYKMIDTRANAALKYVFLSYLCFLFSFHVSFVCRDQGGQRASLLLPGGQRCVAFTWQTIGSFGRRSCISQSGMGSKGTSRGLYPVMIVYLNVHACKRESETIKWVRGKGRQEDRSEGRTGCPHKFLEHIQQDKKPIRLANRGSALRMKK